MRPAVPHVLSLCPEVGEDLVREHLKRLDDEYFERFELVEIVRHLQGLTRLSRSHPVEVLIAPAEGGFVSCTILAFDYPSAFSLITGALCAVGASVLSGDVFTWARAIQRRPVRRVPRNPRTRVQRYAAPPAPPDRRRIIDHFVCALEGNWPLREWGERLRRFLEEIFLLLEQGDAESAREAKHRVNELVTRRLVELDLPEHPVLLPVEIDVDNDSGPFTRLTVAGQDTPAFLYSMSNALALQGCSIEAVRIRTEHGRVCDEIILVDAEGRQVDDAERINRIKLCAVLTKQFTYFLDKAPDPYTALSRFEQLVDQFVRLRDSGDSVERLREPRLMEDLARLLGASDYLWEDFIRLQYEALLPILRSETDHASGVEQAVLREELRRRLDDAKSFDELREALNRFKDEQIFRIDLDHILDPEIGFREFAERLTDLAEVVVEAAAEIVYGLLVGRYGRPRTVAGLEANYAIFGLGKLGGRALGYASDIEILVVFDDSGRTDGEESRSNAEFFSELALSLAKVIRAKREGIFEVDLRLRPYGQSGPAACSVETFCKYYGTDGEAHSAEKLALVRMRTIAGDRELGRRLESVRDHYLYASRNVDPEEIYELRVRQYEDRSRPGQYNVKYSRGALVDLEYTVQLLQVLHGARHPQLETPRIHEALEGLRGAGVVAEDECRRLNVAYDFYRQLINGLRMLRGSAKDLYLPKQGSDEFVHLARRMGYVKRGDLLPEQQLWIEFETCSATVRAFVERQLGPDSLPGAPLGNVVDLILAEDPDPTLRDQILGDIGFRDPARAFTNLRRLAARDPDRETFSALAVLACGLLRDEPDADMALNNWERFLEARGDGPQHFAMLLSQPRRLAILVGIFSRSQFLADTLIRNPEFFDWVTTPEQLHGTRRRGELERELRALAKSAASPGAWLDAIRVFRRREILRIGTRDMCLQAPIREVVADLSTLAEATIQVTLHQVWKDLRAAGELDGIEDLPERFCVLAFGKLGGSELNYSSDIDLLAIWDDAGVDHDPSARARMEAAATHAIRRVFSDLVTRTAEGYVYRVDLRLRPFGSVGEVVSAIPSLERYYRESAKLWEVQALLKLRPLAGHLQVGYDCVERLRPILMEGRSATEIAKGIRDMRELAIAEHSARSLGGGTDIKNGVGGIRDIEFLAQGLQLAHAGSQPSLLTGNTLQALEALVEARLLAADVAAELGAEYVWFRRVEHYLQILEDRQTHAIPERADQLESLARRVGGRKATAESFTRELEARMARVRRVYDLHLPSASGVLGEE